MANTDIATRALIVTLKAYGGKSSREIATLAGVTDRTVDRLYKKARERGFDLTSQPIILKKEHLEDAPRPGRPSKQTEEIIQQVIAKIQRDRYGREKTAAAIAAELTEEGTHISPPTVFRILKKANFRKTKPTRKPGLTKRMRDDRLKWCQEHLNWSLEDWKKVIWSDKTSVVLLHQRGGYRIWRQPKEAFSRSYIHERWKGASEFIFWGCFSYDKKGPSHCWKPETTQERRIAEARVEELNAKLEPAARERWELNTPMARLSIRRRPPGRRPQWRWSQRTGKLARSGKNGINWYAYQTKVLVPKLIPFTKTYDLTRPGTIVQEDKAPSHNHYIQQRIYNSHQVKRLLWPGNSPDLNPIKPTWPYLKRVTTKKGAPKSRQEAITAWEAAWEELPQSRIQGWIERLPRHVKTIVELKGGNEYKEGRADPR
ncbi:hypothetical protein NLG97_g9447 [Lecanicillium saksenae]|uniref:Uncharacterized protein n=1 Tax=Lecanicillium saksenae TaxID=468837 RepID=A0ACC1QHA7_9HYPO|nr:hypothetical protein NLG97_g9447 [Lecanicillium saksenae]